ncbi:hypothetical protein cyc_08758 [Cyclospora cayetanensis]|uniref:Uncharacterized protein n=1 Tax=Cyclospora cayetanensis TaxID=88456 RepID=A0A1D3CSF9_9EIME|nr:hypothetical protein cyc_08758 [Cyclospora cayetanensis]
MLVEPQGQQPPWRGYPSSSVSSNKIGFLFPSRRETTQGNLLLAEELSVSQGETPKAAQMEAAAFEAEALQHSSIGDSRTPPAFGCSDTLQHAILSRLLASRSRQPHPLLSGGAAAAASPSQRLEEQQHPLSHACRGMQRLRSLPVISSSDSEQKKRPAAAAAAATAVKDTQPAQYLPRKVSARHSPAPLLAPKGAAVAASWLLSPS